MKKETFNIRATAKILKHNPHKEIVLEARDVYLASESITQANLLSPKQIEFSQEAEGIAIEIQRYNDPTLTHKYRIVGDWVSVEDEIG